MKEINLSCMDHSSMASSPGGTPGPPMDPDRSSISSWSMMSGKDGSPPPSTSQRHVPSSLPRAIEGISSSTPIPSAEPSPLPYDDPPGLPPHGIISSSAVSTDDQKELIQRYVSLQEEKGKLSEKVTMLENSASAMADDLVKKANIIQYYCMESKSGN